MSYIPPAVVKAWICTLDDSAYSRDVPKQFKLKYGNELVYNLDKIASGYIRKLYGNKSIFSSDALKIKGDDLFFIEFKNQPQSNVNSEDVQAKALASLLVLQIALFPEKSLSEISQKSHFYVIYKDSTLGNNDYYQKTVNKLGDFAKVVDEPILFGLRHHMEAGLYNDIHTIPVSIFEEKYSTGIFE